MYGTTLNYDCHFFIEGADGSPNARELSGVQSLDISYSNSSNVLTPLGSTRGLTTVGGAKSNCFFF